MKQDIDADCIIAISDAWDRMDNAAQRILTALPWQMSDAANELDAARLAFRSCLQVAFLRSARANAA